MAFVRHINGEVLDASRLNDLQIGLEQDDADFATVNTNITNLGTRVTNVENALPTKSDNTHTHTTTIGATFVLDGFGIAVAAATKTELRIPFAGTITGWTIVADRSGSIVCTINQATQAAYPTWTAISGTEKPTLSSAQKDQDLTLTTWTTAVAAGDWLQVSVDSASTVQRVVLSIDITRTIT